MKKGKELKVNEFKNYNVVYGSVNNKNPKAIYINISAWAEPKIEGLSNYNRVIRDTDKNLRQTVYNSIESNTLIPFFKDKTIVDFDIRESGVKYGKRSFTNCEVTLYMKNEISVNSDALKPTIYNLIETSINSVFENNEYFKFYKRKK
jgi:hypothetical protein